MSSLHELWFASKDGLRIACRRWHSHGPARGVFQIAHGMLLVWLCGVLRGPSHHSEVLWAQ
jgi:hypothetical protein